MQERFKDDKSLSHAGLSFKRFRSTLPQINRRYPDVEPVYEDQETENND